MASYGHDKARLLARLKRAEGQLRGIQRMVEKDTYCIEILQQIASVQAATQQVGFMLVENHMRGCVADALAKGEDEGEKSIAEMMTVLRQFTNTPVRPKEKPKSAKKGTAVAENESDAEQT